jgi:hypothetical protein
VAVRRLLTAVMALGLVAGCAGGTTGSATPSPTSRPSVGTPVASPTPVVPPGATLLRDTFLKPGTTYVTAGFLPRFTFSVPSDAATNYWFTSSTALTHTLTIGNPASEGAGVTIYQPTGGYDYAGQPAPLPTDMVAWLTQDPQLHASAPKPVTVGGVAGTEVDVAAITAEIPNPPSLCHTNSACVLVASTNPDAPLRPLQIFQGETFRILILEVKGLPVVFWVDPGSVGVEAQKLIDSMEFLPASS